MNASAPSSQHAFFDAPHRNFLSLTIPVLFSLIAEPLTGLVDTAFIARLGSASLAALGVGAIVLSSVFWIFNFLGIGTQTEVSQAHGRGEHRRIKRKSGLAILMGLCFGFFLAVIGWLFAGPAATLMGAAGEVHAGAVIYLRLRLLGAPAIVVTITTFGILRGLQDMRTPLWVAVAINVLNILLDIILIFGMGPIPALGIAGAALASTVSQWLGALWSAAVVLARLGLPDRLLADDVKKLLQAGGDLIIRTGLLTLFLVLATRSATRIGPDAGAAHQAIRQVWVFANLFLDATAITAQSLIGFFYGSGRFREARRVAAIVCLWSAGAGCVMTLIMLLGYRFAAIAFVPASALAIFTPAWFVAALAQPVSALSFITDGIHWGTGDYRYLRNVVALATICGILGLILLDENRPGALTWIWIVTAIWIVIRAVFGIIRVWPGIGDSPLAATNALEAPAASGTEGAQATATSKSAGRKG